MGYEITRGTKLVVGRVTERFKGGSEGFGGVKGGSTLVKGGLLDPY